MATYTKGDKVKVVNLDKSGGFHGYIGQTATIERVHSDFYEGRFKDGTLYNLRDSEVESTSTSTAWFLGADSPMMFSKESYTSALKYMTCGDWGKKEIGWDVGITKLTKKTGMSKVSTMMKKLLDADTRKLVEAGFINGDLELTEEGWVNLRTILFIEKKAEMVKLAEEKIAEAEKAKK